MKTIIYTFGQDKGVQENTWEKGGTGRTFGSSVPKKTGSKSRKVKDLDVSHTVITDEKQVFD